MSLKYVVLAGAMVVSLVGASSYVRAGEMTVGNPGPAAADVQELSLEDKVVPPPPPPPAPEPAPVKKAHHHKAKAKAAKTAKKAPAKPPAAPAAK